MKKFIYTALASLVIGLGMYVQAADNVDPTTSGVSRQVEVTRWDTAAVGSEADSTAGLVITNVISANSAVVGKIVWVPTLSGDRLQIFNASSGATATAANRIFDSPVALATATNVTVIYDLLPGLSGASGLTTIVTRADTNFTVKAYIMWDKTLSN